MTDEEIQELRESFNWPLNPRNRLINKAIDEAEKMQAIRNLIELQ